MRDLLESLIDHLRDQTGEQGTAFGLEAGIRVDFNEHELEVLVHHEIVTEELNKI